MIEWNWKWPVISWLAWSIFACDNPDVRKSSELDQERVLGVSVTPHEISLRDAPNELDIQLIAFKSERFTSHRWTLCPSLGAVARFDCFEGAPEVTGESSEVKFKIPFSIEPFNLISSQFDETLVASWLPPTCPHYDIQPCSVDQPCDGGGLCIKGTCRSPTELVPLELILRVESVSVLGTTEVSAVTIPVLPTTSNNSAIKLTRLQAGNNSIAPSNPRGECPLVPLIEDSASVDLTVILDDSTIDTFESAEGESCFERSELESGMISWFSDGGELTRMLSDLDDPTNELTFDSEQLQTTVFAVLRDGRGSLDYICAVLQNAVP